MESQDKIRLILDTKYNTGADGLSGNDDFGQMSAWYIFSSLGFYPVAPGSVEYALGSPSLKEATMNLPNGNTFKMIAENQSDKNVYVQKVELNGKVLKRPFIQHSDIMNGGILKFYMTNMPNKELYKIK